MQVREYRESDLVRAARHSRAQGFDYPLPNLSNPLFVTKLICSKAPRRPRRISFRRGFPSRLTSAWERKNCPIIGAALLRLTAEAYLLLDPKAGTPRERWHWLLHLHAATERDAWQRGLEDVHAWLPPPIASKFGKRIAQLGWNRDDTWTPYCKRLPA